MMTCRSRNLKACNTQAEIVSGVECAATEQSNCGATCQVLTTFSPTSSIHNYKDSCFSRGVTYDAGGKYVTRDIISKAMLGETFSTGHTVLEARKTLSTDQFRTSLSKQISIEELDDN